MIKKISIIIIFLLLICGISIADNYIINDDTVYVDDSKVYLSATPHTLSNSGWVYFNLTSKVYMGNIDACWGFNTSVSKPTKAEIYSPRWINTTTNHQKIFYNPTHVVYTGDDLNYGNSYNTNYKYTITESVINDNGTTYITSNAAFDSYTINGTNYTIYWHTRHDNYYLWEDFSSSFSLINYNYEGYDKWYYIKNVPILSNKEYTVRVWIDVPVSTQKQSGKYYFAIKSSGETISQAINNGHFYNLDPWWNATWSNRKNIILTGGTSGAQTDYQILLNITYESEMQSDFDDLRFTNDNDTHELDSWLEFKMDGSYALIWVEFLTTPANGVNQTYCLYYGNAGADSNYNGDATFLNFFSFDLYTNGNLDGQDGWTVFGGSGTHTIQNIIAKHGTKSVQGPVFDNADYRAITVQSTGVATMWMRQSATDRSGYFILSDTTSWVPSGPTVALMNDGHFKYVNSVGDWANLSTDTTYLANTWYKIEVTFDTVNDKYVSVKIDDVEKMADVACQSIADVEYLWLRTHTGGSVYYDTAFFRKYAAGPPTYVFGSEEYYIPTSTTLINETKLIMSEITTGLKGVNMGDYLVYAFILIGILLIILLIQILNNCIYRG